MNKLKKLKIVKNVNLITTKFDINLTLCNK